MALTWHIQATCLSKGISPPQKIYLPQNALPIYFPATVGLLNQLQCGIICLRTRTHAKMQKKSCTHLLFPAIHTIYYNRFNLPLLLHLNFITS